MHKKLVDARHAEIARRYRWHARNQLKYRYASIAAIRVAELSRLFRARYGNELPNDDAGRDDLAIMLNHLANMSGDPRRRCRSWIKAHAPWIPVGEAETTIATIIMDPRRYSADKLAWKLHLTFADRSTLHITTIGAVDCNKAQRLQLRKAKSAQRSHRWRIRKKPP